MNEFPSDTNEETSRSASIHDLLIRLDLAVEVLEGLDELGVDNRTQLEALVHRLERQIAESS
jgi:hypothetical protein